VSIPREAGARVSGEEAARLLRLATTASVATAVLLIFVKLAAFVLTDSVSILSTLIDSPWRPQADSSCPATGRRDAGDRSSRSRR
jgi:hypothetical protein